MPVVNINANMILVDAPPGDRAPDENPGPLSVLDFTPLPEESRIRVMEYRTDGTSYVDPPGVTIPYTPMFGVLQYATGWFGIFRARRALDAGEISLTGHGLGPSEYQAVISGVFEEGGHCYDANVVVEMRGQDARQSAQLEAINRFLWLRWAFGNYFQY